MEEGFIAQRACDGKPYLDYAARRAKPRRGREYRAASLGMTILVCGSEKRETAKLWARKAVAGERVGCIFKAIQDGKAEFQSRAKARQSERKFAEKSRWPQLRGRPSKPTRW